MYLHIGGDKVVDDEEILLILPRETVMHSYDNRRFMETAIGSGPRGRRIRRRAGHIHNHRRPRGNKGIRLGGRGSYNS